MSKEATFIPAYSSYFREFVVGLTALSKSDANCNIAPAKALKPEEVGKKDIMDQKYQLPFKAGQLAEARSFEVGFRGAWFRCKIKEISGRRGHWNALLEYFDYPDEKLTWTKLYQMPPYQSGNSEETQLMLRPQYPPIHPNCKVSDVSSNCIISIAVDSTWKAGDLVDWPNSGCYWSGKLTKLLGNGKAEIELVPPPLGEGATYEVFVKDLRPSLDWSPEFGWALPASPDGESCQCVQILKPVSKGHAMADGRRDSRATTELSSNTSVCTRLFGNLLPNENRDFNTIEFLEHHLSSANPKDAANRSKDALNQTSYASSTTHIVAKSRPTLDEKRGSKSKELVERPSNVAVSEASNTSKESIWSDSESRSPIGDDTAKRSAGPTDMDPYYSNRPLKKFRTSGGIRLNSMESDSMEAAIMDLEELANKISWLKGIMECGTTLSDAFRPSWKFVEHYGTSIDK